MSPAIGGGARAEKKRIHGVSLPMHTRAGGRRSIDPRNQRRRPRPRDTGGRGADWEVDRFLTFGIEDEILQFEISVNDLVRVHVEDAREDAEQDDGRFDFGASSLLLKPIDDDIALGQVGDNVHILPVPAVRAHLYAVLVLNLRGGAGEAERDSGKGVSLTELGSSQSRTSGARGRRGWSFVMGRESLRVLTTRSVSISRCTTPSAAGNFEVSTILMTNTRKRGGFSKEVRPSSSRIGESSITWRVAAQTKDSSICPSPENSPLPLRARPYFELSPFAPVSRCPC